MSMGERARLPLPSVVNPEDRVCVPVWVPNEEHHRAAFWGKLYELAKPYSWENDAEHTAIEVAAVWLQVFNDALLAVGDCENMTFDVRQNEDEPCTLEKSDDGETWVEWANLQLCPPKIRINRGVAQWFNPATSVWENVPDTGDEREDGSYDPPWPEESVPEGQSAECLSAENILATYSTVMTQARAGVIAGQFAVAISATVTGILGIFIPQAIISTIALALAGICLDLGEAGLDDMLDTETLNLLKCNLYDHAENDGSFTAIGYDDFYGQLSTDFSSLKLTAMQLYFDMLGPVGLSRQGAANDIESGDCDICIGEWCYTLMGDGGTEWALIIGTNNANRLQNTAQPFGLHYYGRASITMPAGDYILDRIQSTFTCCSGAPRLSLWLNDSSWDDGTRFVTSLSGTLDATGLSIGPGDIIYIQLNADTPENTRLLQSVILSGTGDNPFGEGNCE